jgi:hypothetical protein
VKLRLSRAVLAVVLALLAFTSSPSSAQVGSTTDILTGTVTNTTGVPIPGATVEAKSFDTQITRRTRTNAEGRYTILFPDGGGQYTLTVKFLGMAPATLNVTHVADEDRLVTNFRLSENPTEIQGVVVRARPTGNANDRPTPGSQERNLTPEQLARLPIDQSDLALLATLAPGVVGIDATDSTASAFSVAGLRPDANSVTLDGLNFGSSTIPQDAVRNTRVITSTYDVARGQFSGGQIASTTKSGSDFVSGTFNYSLRDQNLAWQDGTPTAFNSGYTQNQLSGGFGGPIVKDKLFVFGSAQARRRVDAVPSLMNADAATLGRVGVSQDSVNRFLSLVRGYGLTPGAGLDDSRDADTYSALVRVDLLASAGQTLTLRGDFRGSGQDPTRIGTLSLPQTGGNQKSSGGGLMAVLSSNFGGRFINELRAYAQTDQRHSDPFFLVPAARVQVNSDLPDASSITTLAFGGNAGLPQRSLTKSLDVSNEVSWLEGNGAHRIKLGVLFSGSQFSQDATSNRLGTYTFNSLEDLADNEPSIFTRTLSPSIRTGRSLNTALYLGDTWRKSRALQLTYGARVEHTQFDGAPAYNPEVEQIFGYRTNEIPTETHVSPRAGFTWVLGGSGAGGAFGGGGFGGFGGRGGGRGGGGGDGAGGGNTARPNANSSTSVPLIIRGGIGEFRSVTPTALYSGAQNATGLSQSESQLYCIGGFVPTPDWSIWTGDDADIPTTCTGGTVNAPPITAHPNVTVFDKSFEAPRAWRASLGAQRRIFDRMQLSVDGNFARGVSQYGFHDLNLNTTPKFTLGDEGGRPVFANPSDIVPATGAVSIASSRIDPQFGQVIAVGSDLQSQSEQLIVSMQGITKIGAIFNISYTLSRAKDQSSASGGSATGGFSAATTAGDPNVREWAPSNFDRRHAFVGTLTYPFNEGLELTAIGRMSSGAPFTPMVASDINADGARNDRAFIFDPNKTADTSVANAMRRLLDSNSQAASCLKSQIGTVAGRNSCTGPWQPSLDFQVNYRPFAFGLNRRLMLSLTTINFLGGLDQLINGQKNLQGWGTSRLGDPTLLYVRGFDPATEHYQYQVNERFGSQHSGQGSVVMPFQIGFQGRYTLGPDRTRDAVRGALATRAAGRAGGDFASRFERILPNPITQIIAEKDSIALTDSQVVRLTAIRDSLDAKNKLVQDAIKAVVDKAGANPDPGALFGALRPKLDEGRANAQKAVTQAKGILTPEQWAKLPDRVKNPGQQGQGNRGPRP